jgi:hypothetical protein
MRERERERERQRGRGRRERGMQVRAHHSTPLCHLYTQKRSGMRNSVTCLLQQTESHSATTSAHLKRQKSPRYDKHLFHTVLHVRGKLVQKVDTVGHDEPPLISTSEGAMEINRATRRCARTHRDRSAEDAITPLLLAVDSCSASSQPRKGNATERLPPMFQSPMLPQQGICASESITSSNCSRSPTAKCTLDEIALLVPSSH